MNIWFRSSVSVLALVATACGGGGGSGATPSPPPVIVIPPPAPTPPPPTPTPSPYPTGLSRSTIDVGGLTREFTLYVPAATTRASGLLILLHGAGGTGPGLASTTAFAAFRDVADRQNMVAIYPTGIDGSWNDCRAGDPDTADVAFIDALIDRVGGAYQVPAGKVLVAGHSNGGMMAMRYAFERPARIAAAAIASANLPATPEAGACGSGPARPVPILFTHGTLDRFAVYGGGCPVPGPGGTCPQGGVIGAEATRDRWLAINGLTGTTPTVTSVDRTSSDGSVAVRHTYAGGTPVEWWRLDGAGHPPPSIAFESTNAAAGPQNRDVEFAEIAIIFASPYLR